LLVLVVEGRQNSTERLYFDHFRTPECPYAIYIEPSHNTDVEGMLRNGLATFGNESNPKSHLFIITDLDVSKEKQDMIAEMQKNEPRVSFIVSEPCFEVWFLLHYDKSLCGIVTSDDAIRKLRRHLPNYEKNKSVFSLDKNFESLVEDAIKNSKQVLAKRENVESGCPATTVHQIVELLTKKKK